MYSYCENNPINRQDLQGESSVAIVTLAGVVLGWLDGPFPICDLFTLALLGLCAEDIENILNPGSTGTKQNIESSDIEDSGIKKTVADDLGSIAGSHGNYRCKEAAGAMVGYLKTNGEQGLER